MVVVLDNIRSLFNTGSIFRTADALGAERIYLCGYTPSPLDKLGRLRPRFLKVSLGSESSVSYVKRVSTLRTINQLKKDGYKILAVEQDDKSIPYYKYIPKDDKYALVIGHEVRGLSKAILKKVDKVLEIPMNGMKESLNVGIAFGIVGYHLKYKKK